MSNTLETLAFLGLPGGYEWLVLLVLGVLLFGRRLPEVGRSLGRSIVEFKKGVKGIEQEIDEASSESKPELDGQKKTYDTEARSIPQHADHPEPGDPPPATQAT